MKFFQKSAVLASLLLFSVANAQSHQKGNAPVPVRPVVDLGDVVRKAERITHNPDDSFSFDLNGEKVLYTYRELDNLWDYAYNVLNSCRPNAILFTNGDNDTFPLWYLQRVYNIRKDVVVVNLSLGNTSWFIKRILKENPSLKLSYSEEEIDRDMDNNINLANPEYQSSTWQDRAESMTQKLKKRIDRMEQGPIADSEQEKYFLYKLHYQVWNAFLKWFEQMNPSFMLTQYKLVVDLTLQNPDRPIEFATTVGENSLMGLEGYMIQEGLVHRLVAGDLTYEKNRFDAEYSARLIDEVFRFRGMTTAYIHDPLRNLFSAYVSIYLQIAFDAREKILKLSNDGGDQSQIDSLAAFAERYLKLGMSQFPEEWRNYWAAAYLFDSAKNKSKALSYAKQGIDATNDKVGKERLELAYKQIQGGD